MKKQLTIIALAALSLASCGGSQKQNGGNATDTTNVETPQCDVSTTTTQRVELTQDVLKDIWQQVHTGDAMDEPEYTADCITLNLVPFDGISSAKVFRIDDTSFKVFYIHNEVPSNPNDWPDGAEYYLSEYVYKDGKLTKTTLQSELEGTFGISGEFLNDTLKFLDTDDKATVFVWNGGKMERK